MEEEGEDNESVARSSDGNTPSGLFDRLFYASDDYQCFCRLLLGCGDIKNITSSMVVRNDHYWRLSGLYRSISSHL